MRELEWSSNWFKVWSLLFPKMFRLMVLGRFLMLVL